jgi:hypothetical protein
MEPREAEKESRKVAQLLVWLAEKTDAFEVEPWVPHVASEVYGNEKELHTLTADLCYWCDKTDPDIIYNGHDRMARKLADWYDTHLEGEERRAQEDEKEDRLNAIAQEAYEKLTEEEREALAFTDRLSW